MSQPEQIGRYRILEELGRGAMGRVVKADDPTIQRQVAIKIIQLGAETSQEEQKLFERSFLREIQAAGVLHHPGIVPVFDAGRLGDFAYIVMELVDGVTLEKLLHAEERPDMGFLLDLCRQVAVALDYAHGNNIVHRDIKPANVLVSQDGTARIADFGIAKISRGSTVSIGKTGLAGTPAYMSPEQITGQRLDGRSDQWSLAAIAYNVLTGAPPFGSDNIAVMFGQIMSIDPAPPSQVNPLLPAEVDAVMAKAFAKDPARRHASCTEMMRALDGIFGTAPVEAAPPVADQPVVADRPAPAPRVEEAVAPRVRKSPTTVLIAAGAVVLLAGVTGAVLLTRSKAGEEPKELKPFTVSPVETDRPTPKEQPPIVKAGTTAPPPPRAESAKILQIHFSTTPAEAQVTVDGKREVSCKSPCSMDLAEGTHALLLQKDGFRTVLQNFTATSGQPEIAVTLKELTGSLLVQSDPPGAAITVNGAARSETTPATLTLAPGKYKVTLTRAGYAPADFEASVMADAVREVSVGLAKQ
jgi:serine/threonine-protein kinase